MRPRPKPTPQGTGVLLGSTYDTTPDPRKLGYVVPTVWAPVPRAAEAGLPRKKVFQPELEVSVPEKALPAVEKPPSSPSHFKHRLHPELMDSPYLASVGDRFVLPQKISRPPDAPEGSPVRIVVTDGRHKDETFVGTIAPLEGADSLPILASNESHSFLVDEGTDTEEELVLPPIVRRPVSPKTRKEIADVTKELEMNTVTLKEVMDAYSDEDRAHHVVRHTMIATREHLPLDYLFEAGVDAQYCRRRFEVMLQPMLDGWMYYRMRSGFKRWLWFIRQCQLQDRNILFRKSLGATRLRELVNRSHRRWKKRRKIRLLKRWYQVMLRERLAEVEAAARQIQRICRGFFGRLVVARMILELLSAVQIQRIFRGWVCRKWFHRVRWLVTQIQRIIRGFLVREMVRRWIRAVVPVQACWRCHVAYIRFKEMRNAAILVQKIVRAFQARDAFRKLYLDSISGTEEEQWSQAIVLQCFWKCYVSRRKAQSIREYRLKRQNAALTLQRWWQNVTHQTSAFFLVRALLVSDMLDDAHMAIARRNLRRLGALNLQRLWRGHVVRVTRRQEKLYHHAALKIQRIYRSMGPRMLLKQYLAEKRVVAVIQRAFRRYTAFLYNTVLKIQRAWWRAALPLDSAKVQIGQYYVDETRLMRHWKLVREQSAFLEERKARVLRSRSAVKLQSFVRGFFVRLFNCRVAAVIVLQRVARGMMGRRCAVGERQKICRYVACINVPQYIERGSLRAMINLKQRYRFAAMTMQCFWRCCMARAVVKGTAERCAVRLAAARVIQGAWKSSRCRWVLSVILAARKRRLTNRFRSEGSVNGLLKTIMVEIRRKFDPWFEQEGMPVTLFLRRADLDLTDMPEEVFGLTTNELKNKSSDELAVLGCTPEQISVIKALSEQWPARDLHYPPQQPLDSEGKPTKKRFKRLPPKPRPLGDARGYLVSFCDRPVRLFARAPFWVKHFQLVDAPLVRNEFLATYPGQHKRSSNLAALIPRNVVSLIMLRNHFRKYPKQAYQALQNAPTELLLNPYAEKEREHDISRLREALDMASEASEQLNAILPRCFLQEKLERAISSAFARAGVWVSDGNHGGSYQWKMNVPPSEWRRNAGTAKRRKKSRRRQSSVAVLEALPGEDHYLGLWVSDSVYALSELIQALDLAARANVAAMMIQAMFKNRLANRMMAALRLSRKIRATEEMRKNQLNARQVWKAEQEAIKKKEMEERVAAAKKEREEEEQALAASVLLCGWEEHFDEDLQSYYFFNPTTGETRWERPTYAIEAFRLCRRIQALVRGVLQRRALQIAREKQRRRDKREKEREWWDKSAPQRQRAVSVQVKLVSGRKLHLSMVIKRGRRELTLGGLMSAEAKSDGSVALADRLTADVRGALKEIWRVCSRCGKSYTGAINLPFSCGKTSYHHCISAAAESLLVLRKNDACYTCTAVEENDGLFENRESFEKPLPTQGEAAGLVVETPSLTLPDAPSLTPTVVTVSPLSPPVPSSRSATPKSPRRSSRRSPRRSPRSPNASPKRPPSRRELAEESKPMKPLPYEQVTSILGIAPSIVLTMQYTRLALPFGWHAIVDERTGVVYFYSDDGQTSWDRPGFSYEEYFAVMLLQRIWRGVLGRKEFCNLLHVDTVLGSIKRIAKQASATASFGFRLEGVTATMLFTKLGWPHLIRLFQLKGKRGGGSTVQKLKNQEAINTRQSFCNDGALPLKRLVKLSDKQLKDKGVTRWVERQKILAIASGDYGTISDIELVWDDPKSRLVYSQAYSYLALNQLALGSMQAQKTALCQLRRGIERANVILLNLKLLWVMNHLKEALGESAKIMQLLEQFDDATEEPVRSMKEEEPDAVRSKRMRIRRVVVKACLVLRLAMEDVVVLDRNVVVWQAQWRRFSQRRKYLQLLARREEAARQIVRAWRWGKCWKILQERKGMKYSEWEECYNDELKQIFFFNIFTGESIWEPPKGLYKPHGWWPVPAPPEDGNCFVCRERAATKRCKVCYFGEDRGKGYGQFKQVGLFRPPPLMEYCFGCFAEKHKTNRELRGHGFDLIGPVHDLPPLPCVECGQQGARTCFDCTDMYCEGCFERVHCKGRKRFHQWVGYWPAAPVCVECGTAMAIKFCSKCEDPFCHHCFRLIHAKGKKQLHPSELIRQPPPIEYLPLEYDEEGLPITDAPLPPFVCDELSDAARAAGLYCPVCDARLGITECDHCRQKLCWSCGLQEHTIGPRTRDAPMCVGTVSAGNPGGNLRDVVRRAVAEVCVECGDFATRVCDECGDPYCDTRWPGNPGCFEKYHTRGHGRRKHTFSAHPRVMFTESAVALQCLWRRRVAIRERRRRQREKEKWAANAIVQNWRYLRLRRRQRIKARGGLVKRLMRRLRWR